MKLAELFEAAVKPIVIQQRIDVEHTLAFIEKHCKDALWMLEHDRPIWRGDSGFKGEKIPFVVDPEQSERASENTSNYYTLLIDNNPYNEQIGMPKRSKSLICSTVSSTSRGYGTLFAVIPFDGVKIGCVNNRDMWFTKFVVFEKERGIESLNYRFINFMDDDFESIKRTSKKLASGDEELLRTIIDEFGLEDEKLIKEIKTDFLGYLQRAYSYKNTGHTVATSATLDKEEDQEVWIGGKCLLIPVDAWGPLYRAAARARSLDNSRV